MGFENASDDLKGDWCTIDKERGYILTRKWGPGPEGDYCFQIEIEGKLVVFACFGPVMKYAGPINTPLGRLYDMTYNFHRLSVPEGITLSRKQISEVIAEALAVFGSNYDKDRAHIVTVKFDPKLIF